MTSSVGCILNYALYPVLALASGGGAALLRPPGAPLRSAIQHFTAGVVFAALATELLPDLMHRRLPWATLTGFALGVLVMLAIKHFTEKAGQDAAPKGKNVDSLLWILGVDFVLDGVLIGLGFAAGKKQGLILTVALSLEVLFLGLSSVTALVSVGATRTRIASFIGFYMACLLFGALGGALVLANASAIVLDATLAFGVAALLYLVTEELLVEAHEVAETPLQTATFFIGFIALLVVEMII